jgi:hypothetical protein
MDPDVPPNLGRVARALALMGASVVAIGISAITYAQPHHSPVSTPKPVAGPPQMVIAPAFHEVQIDGDGTVVVIAAGGGTTRWRAVRTPAITR